MSTAKGGATGNRYPIMDAGCDSPVTEPRDERIAVVEEDWEQMVGFGLGFLAAPPVEQRLLQAGPVADGDTPPCRRPGFEPWELGPKDCGLQPVQPTVDAHELVVVAATTA